MSRTNGVSIRFAAVFSELDTLLKDPTIGAELAQLGINTSLALLASQGLAAYLRGDKPEAAEDLATAAEEIRVRLTAASSAQREPS
jgi:hypothetical protein